jgi:peptide-methionine (R)-S-oxide reductase
MAFVAAPLQTTLLRSPRLLAHVSRARPLRAAARAAARAAPLRMTSGAPNKDAAAMTDRDWKEALDPKAYHVLRQKGTEPAGSGEYDTFYPDGGHFVCGGCRAPLYSAEAKFKSGCGWPAFDKCYKGAINTITDSSYGMRRVEIVCGNCEGHLGHVFEGERMTPTNERHCVNSVRRAVPTPRRRAFFP